MLPLICSNASSTTQTQKESPSQKANYWAGGPQSLSITICFHICSVWDYNILH